jgi:hypothetical protein
MIQDPPIQFRAVGKLRLELLGDRAGGKLLVAWEIAVTKSDRQTFHLLGRFRKGMGLCVEDDLQRMLDAPEEAIIRLQQRSFLRRQAPRAFQLDNRQQRVARGGRFQLSGVQQL